MRETIYCIWIYSSSFWSYWYLWPTGGVGLSALIYMREYKTGKSLTWDQFKAVLIVGAIVASFQVWRDAHTDLAASRGMVRQLEAVNLKLRTDNGAMTKALISRDKPLQVIATSKPARPKDIQFVADLASEMHKAYYEEEKKSPMHTKDRNAGWKEFNRNAIGVFKKEGFPEKAEKAVGILESRGLIGIGMIDPYCRTDGGRADWLSSCADQLRTYSYPSPASP